MITLTRAYRFPAAHVLAHPDLSLEENRRLYGKCANPAGHGHDYGVEVTVTGPVDPRTGQLVDRRRLDRLVDERVLARFSHRMLNEDPAFQRDVPTAENIARFVWGEVAPVLAAEGSARVVRIDVVETAKNRFSYEEPAA